MKQFGEEQDCDSTKLAWYFHSRRVYQTDRPALVNGSVSLIQTEADLRQIGIRDGDTLDAYASQGYSSTNEDEQWLAQLAATEQKIIQLQTEVDFKRAELEAATIENETVATRVSAIRSGICLLRQKKRNCRSSRVARS